MALVVMLLLASCSVPDQPVAPTAEQVVVHAILDPGSRVQLVLVERARTGDRNAVACGPSGSGIGGADVSITTPSGVEMRGVEDTTHLKFGCLERLYRVPLDAYGVSLTPGGSYGLRVRTPSGQEVTGSTTIPDVSLTVPEPPPEPFNYLRDTLRLQWVGARGAASYEVRVDVHEGLDLSSVYFVSDTSAALPGTLRDLDNNYIFGARVVNVVVSAVDRNYYDYYRLRSDPFTPGSVVAGLTGGQGVFGSLVVLTRRTLAMH